MKHRILPSEPPTTTDILLRSLVKSCTNTCANITTTRIAVPAPRRPCTPSGEVRTRMFSIRYLCGVPYKKKHRMMPGTRREDSGLRTRMSMVIHCLQNTHSRSMVGRGNEQRGPSCAPVLGKTRICGIRSWLFAASTHLRISLHEYDAGSLSYNDERKRNWD